MSDAAQNAPATEQEKQAPSRMRVLMRNPRRLIIAAALILIAALVVVFTTATFTSSSANAGNMVAAGTLAISNDKEGTAIFTASNLIPGDTAKGTVTISNTGSAAGNFSLSTSNLVDTPATPAFSGKLDLVINDITGGTTTQIYSGKLNAVGTIQLGKWNGGTQHKYEFITTFPNGIPSDDNQYKGAQTTLNFNWNVVS